MDLLTKFHEYISRIIDEKGIHPFPGMAIIEDGKMEVAALCEATTAFDWFWDQVTTKQSKECIFGLDRSTDDRQGTEFDDVLTCVHWAEGMDGKEWATSFRIGVINYQNEPRIVREFDFSNAFWMERMTSEVKSFRPWMRTVVKSS